MKGIGYQDGARQHAGEDGSVGAREIERGVAHVREPLMALGLEPRGGLFSTATRYDVEELRSAHVDDRGRELGAVIRRLAKKGHLIEPKGANYPEAIWILGQGLAVGEDGVVDGMPVTAEFFGHLGDAARAAPHLFGDPATRTVGHLQT